MKTGDPIDNPVRRLALAYARSDVRVAWQLVLGLDSRLADVVLCASEPMIAQMKLAWWHDALSAPAGSRPKGEPMLAALEAAEDNAKIAAAMLHLVEAWQNIAASDDGDVDARRDFAEHRAQAIFASYANWIGATAADQTLALETGRRWALADIATQHGRGTLTAPQRLRLPPPLRPLSILAFAAQRVLHDRRGRADGVRLIVHALTGR